VQHFSQSQSISPDTAPDRIDALLPAPRRFLVAVDESLMSYKTLPYAVTVADALGADLQLVHVLGLVQNRGMATDPLGWRLSRQAAKSRIQNNARPWLRKDQNVKITIKEGYAADQICRLAREVGADLTVFCLQDAHGSGRDSISATAHALIHSAPCSVLVVPAGIDDAPRVSFRRIVVPLDGSSRAERVLPIAAQIAASNTAELLLVHVVPEPELTEIGVPQPEDDELRASWRLRNERVAREYLGRMRTSLASRGIPVRIRLLFDGDVRHLLARTIEEEGADLVVMSSHGRTGHMDLTVGSVAAYLSSRATVPLLLVRSPLTASGEWDNGTDPAAATDSRFLDQAVA